MRTQTESCPVKRFDISSAEGSTPITAAMAKKRVSRLATADARHTRCRSVRIVVKESVVRYVCYLRCYFTDLFVTLRCAETGKVHNKFLITY
jgi:hypothetical protein